MNIFAFHDDPRTCARWLDSKRIGTALKECNQMLSLAVKVHLPEAEWMDDVGEGMLTAGMSHLNHPVSIWVRACRNNFNWTMMYATSLFEEHLARYGTKHASHERTEYIRKHFAGAVPIMDGKRQPFQNSARHKGKGLDFTHLPVHEAYKTYIVARWKTDARPPEWPEGQMPEWALDKEINAAAVEALRKAGDQICADT